MVMRNIRRSFLRAERGEPVYKEIVSRIDKLINGTQIVSAMSSDEPAIVQRPPAPDARDLARCGLNAP
jgi:hypothetical protein